MMRLIDADELFTTPMPNARGNGKPLLSLWAYVVDQITHAPTIDLESLRPKGRKERSAISKTGLVCTTCYSDVDRDAVFCKYCGAKMEG